MRPRVQFQLQLTEPAPKWPAFSAVGKLERWLSKETIANLPNTKCFENAKWFELVVVVPNDGGKSKAVKHA